MAAIASAAMLGTLVAAPSFAACLPGPYLSLPPVSYSGSVLASQNVIFSVDSTLSSLNGLHKMTFQKDGNLVFNWNGARIIWSSKTQNCLPTPYATMYAKFQSDGNLVVYYTLQNNPTVPIAVWASNTQGHPNARLTVTEDGLLAIYDSNNTKLWAIAN